MRALFAVLILAGSLGAPFAGMPSAALAQNAGPPLAQPPAAADDARPDAAPEAKAAGAADKPSSEPDRAKRLDALFAALKAAPDKESAKGIAERIDIALTPSGSDTADLLMSRAALATEAKDFDLAVQLLDGVLKVSPDHLEAWNKRATVFYLKQDFADALVDLRQVVAREPRHYGAWAGIAIICKEIGDEKRALEAVRQARAIYPYLDEMDDMEKTLSISVEGRPI
ncbi:tetratricopeptide repeat protein [Ancylobacter koreensis]